MFGSCHFFLQLFLVFYGLSFMDRPVPPSGSISHVLLVVASILLYVLIFPVAYVAALFSFLLDTPEKLALGLLANSVLWTAVFVVVFGWFTRARAARKRGLG